LEQYPTSPYLAASVIRLALEYGDLGPGRSALDLGCGTGMLTIACALAECDWVMGVDCDGDALERARHNVNHLDAAPLVSLIQARIPTPSVVSKSGTSSSKGKGRGGRSGNKGSRTGRGSGRGSTSQSSNNAHNNDDDDGYDGIPLRSHSVDTVVTNPPFGTKKHVGMDLRFLRTATRLARRAVYSFHKSSTRNYVLRQVAAWGYQGKVVSRMKFDLPQTYFFHKEASVDIEVDLIRVVIDDSLLEPDKVKTVTQADDLHGISDNHDLDEDSSSESEQE
jgi:rRNA N6-adenosine-methyltransferase METTL5